MTFYLDETGNSGDVVVRAGREMFGGQPVFALAAVGESPGAPDLGDAIRALVKEHHVDGAETELKGGKIVRSRPAFVLALIRHLVEHDHPIVVELVDKGYHLAVQIVQHFLLGVPTLGGGLDPHSVKTWALANRLAEVVYDHADRGTYELYSSAALSRSTGDLYRFAVAFALRFNASLAAADANHTSDKAALAEAVTYGYGASVAFDAFRKKSDFEDEQIVGDFLPLPDTDSRGNRLAMHSHATSFLNILARMNRVATDLGCPNLTLVHDEQLQLEPVVLQHHEALTSGVFSFLDGRLAGAGVPYEGNVLYTFSGDHDLRFEDSKNAPGLQAADVVAATCRVYYQQATDPTAKTPEALEDAARLLAHLSDGGSPRGVNTVASYGRARSTFARGLPAVPPWSLIPPPRLGA